MGIAEGGQIIEFGFKFNTWGPRLSENSEYVNPEMSWVFPWVNFLTGNWK